MSWSYRKLALLIIALGVAAPVVNSGHAPEALEEAFELLVGWMGVLAIAAGIHRARPRGILWPLLMASAALSAVATMMPTVVGEGGGAGTPQVGDAIVLLSSLLLAAAMVRILITSDRRLFVALDTLTLVAIVGLVAGVLVLAPSLAASTLGLGTRITLIANAVADVIVLSAVIHLLLAARPLLPATRLVAAAGAAFVASEVLWNWLAISGSFSPGVWADNGWNLQPLLLGLAALHPSMGLLGGQENRSDGELRHTTPILLGIAALVGPLLIGAQDIGSNADFTRVLVVWVGGATLSVLVVTRFSLLLRHSGEQQRALDKDLAERGRLLLEFEDRYRQLVEQIPAVIYEAYVDEDGVVHWQYMSPQCTTILGIAADALYEDPEAWWAPVHGENRECVRASFARRDGAARPEATEFRFVRPDGVEIWLRDTATVVCDAAARHVHGLMFDVTLAKHAKSEQERMELELRLAQKLEAVGQLAAGIAHEINTPIQFIGDSVGFLHSAFGDLMALVGLYDELKRSAEHGPPPPELMQRLGDAELEADMEYLTERVPAAFERTVDGVQRVATIVRAMREFGHPPTADLSPVDLNAVIENTLIVATSEYKYVADVTCELGQLPAVVCNRGDINQVLLNLIVNAAHAIGDVVGESGERGTITIRTAAQEETVRISIADTGGGIAAEIGGRIYDPFFTTKAVGRGTGQGLAITRTIVERHEGTIAFDTIAGEGTTFHITLPTRVASPQAQPQGITA